MKLWIIAAILVLILMMTTLTTMTWTDAVVLCVIVIVCFTPYMAFVLAGWFVDQMQHEKRKDQDS